MLITVVEPHYYWPEFTKKTFLDIQEHIERCGRVCYKSEDRITPGSANKFVNMICRNHHESVLEHASLTAIIVGSRSMSHQLVRHRLGSYSQESQRYCNYGKKGFQVICPPSIGVPAGEYDLDNLHLMAEIDVKEQTWLNIIGGCCEDYVYFMENGCKPEDARSVLPNACKTEIAVTYNLRAWRHVIRERGLNKHAQWEIRSIFHSIYEDLQVKLPSVFGDLE